MKYTTGKIGRCFVVRFEDGDDILGELSELVRNEQVNAAVFYLVGGIKKGRIVVGPEHEEMPPQPMWREISESHETMGIGTIFRAEDGPKIHLHGMYAKRDSVKGGCLRGNAETFLIMEAVVLEIEGVDARRELDPISNMVLLKL